MKLRQGQDLLPLERSATSFGLSPLLLKPLACLLPALAELIHRGSTTPWCVHSSPRSNGNWNSAPGSRSLATVTELISSGMLIGPPIDPVMSAPVGSSVTTWPSARVKIDRCDRSHRAKALFMAS